MFKVQDGFGGLLYEHEFQIFGKPGITIYFLIRSGDVVYVGKSESSLFNRINSHIKDDEKEFSSVFAVEVDDMEFTLDEIEHAFISYYQPEYNIALKDDINQKDFDIISRFISMQEQSDREAQEAREAREA